MAEVITETILPGTYIEVRAEGLLTIGAIATGNIGIVGTAEKGSAQIRTLSSFEEGRAIFGEMGDWDPNAGDGNLTLVRALRYLFDNGATTVYARRVLDESKAKPALFTLKNESGTEVLTLAAKTAGTWGNRLEIRVEDADAQEFIGDELLARSNGKLALSALEILQPDANGDQPSIGSVTVAQEGLAKKFQLKLPPAQISADVVVADPSSRALSFALEPSTTAEVRASYWVPKESKSEPKKSLLRKVTFRYGNVQEAYIVPSISYLVQRLKGETAPSRLVEIVPSDVSDPALLAGTPLNTARFEQFSTGENGAVSRDHFQAALDDLVEQNVQIVVVAGVNFTKMKAAILAHAERTENLGRERIIVVGTDNSDTSKILENANDIADKRVVLVAPGLKQQVNGNGKIVELPPYFTAAAVAGKLSSLAPHISLTNKPVAGIDQLAADFNYGDLKSLVQNRVLVLQRKRGVRIVKGVTTDDEAFKQITVRRITDYIKEGTRIGANQYIGKLNNKRVRDNLRTTLDGFLADTFLREFLTGYKLQVYADRAMEIRGEVQVLMDLNPTFSIDVIRVVANLS